MFNFNSHKLFTHLATFGILLSILTLTVLFKTNSDIKYSAQASSQSISNGLTNSSITESSVASSLTSSNLSSVESKNVAITGIVQTGSNYIINFATSGFTNTVGGFHTHFYYDTEPNTVTNKMYSQSSLYNLPISTKPNNATKICSIVGTPSHGVIVNTGNCVDLPASVTISASSTSLNQNTSSSSTSPSSSINPDDCLV